MKDSNNLKEKPRLPPGQHLTNKFPVLQKGKIAHIDRDSYTLEITGEVESPKIFTLQDLERLKDKEIVEDIHCETSWSKFDTRWGGISFKTIFKIVKPKNSAHFVEFIVLIKALPQQFQLRTSRQIM